MAIMLNDTKIILITQARVGSSRLPGKVLKDICGQSILSIHLHRLKEAQYVKKIIVATTKEEGVENIIKIANQSNVKYSQGSTQDVLSRFYDAAFNEQPNYIVRVTSDCPLLDPRLVDEVIKFTVENELDYGSNMMIQNYPDGQDVEVFTFDALKLAHENAKLNSEREHVTPYIVKNSSFNEHLLVLFYEDLFEKKTWNNVLDFIKLETNFKGDFGKVNASPDIHMGLSEEVRREAIKAYSDTYMYMKKEYPQVENLWESSFKLLN